MILMVKYIASPLSLLMLIVSMVTCIYIFGLKIDFFFFLAFGGGGGGYGGKINNLIDVA